MVVEVAGLGRLLSVGTWLVVDAVLDTVISMQVVSGGHGDTIARAQSLRERGWQLNAVHPLAGEGPVGAGTAQMLSSEQLHPHVRAEQEQSVSGLQDLRAELAQVAGP